MKKTSKAQRAMRQRNRRRSGGGPDVSGAADLLDRVYHKLTCFAALFGGDEKVAELIDHAGAWIILTEILDEIEQAENLLIGNREQQRTS